MTTRRAPAALAAAALLLLATTGCGGDAEVAADPAGTSTASSTPAPSGDPTTGTGETEIDHPTGADDVVLRIEVDGGFVPVEFAFATQPQVLLTGDGRLLAPPPGNPQARLVAMEVAQLDEQQVQQLLDLAEDAGLLGDPPGYVDDDGPQVADAPTTTVTLSAGGGTWVHEAYALGFGDDAGSRQALSDFVGAAVALAADVETEPFEPNQVALLVQPTDLERDVRPWPVEEVDLSRADATGCSTYPAAGLVEALDETGATTSFRQGAGLYSVAGRALLPGDGVPCPA